MLSFYLGLLETNSDRNKFEEYYITYRQDMFRIAYSILNNKENAEDAVHEAFVRIANNFTKISQIDCRKVMSYFVIIVRNISIDMIRCTKHESYISVDDEAFEMPSVCNVTEQMDYSDLIEKLNRIPPIYREVLLLCARGYKTSEIAELLNIAYKAASQRINRARMLLHQQIMEEQNEQYG